MTDETAEDQWTPCDATLPPGWQFKEVRLQNGSLRKSYLSPCGKRLGGRDTVAEFLLCQGLDILHPTGFSETCCLPGLILISSFVNPILCLPGLPTPCPGFCEGGCPALNIHPSFYSSTDPNRIRRRAVINFVTDVNVDKMREVKKVRFVSKREEEPDPVGYGAPLIRAERPWVIFIDNRTEEEKKMDEIKQAMGQGVTVKQEQSIPDMEFQIPTIESYGSTEPVDDKEAVGKYIKNIKVEDKKYLEGLVDVGSSNKRKKSESDEKATVKRRKASPSEDESSFGTSPIYEAERQTNRFVQDKGRKGGARRRSVVSPIKMQEKILSEKEKRLSKERSYLKEVEKPRRRISIDSKSEEDEDAEDPGERDKDYQVEEEEDEEEEEEVPIKADRSKHHQTRLKMGASPSIDKSLKQPSRGPTTQELKKRKNVEALKRLQKRDLEENRTGGTYVQCCNQMCAKWRLVAEYLESSQVGFHTEYTPAPLNLIFNSFSFYSRGLGLFFLLIKERPLPSGA